MQSRNRARETRSGPCGRYSGVEHVSRGKRSDRVSDPGKETVGNIPTSWSVVGTGDFNGDGMTDIVWRDSVGDTSI